MIQLAQALRTNIEVAFHAFAWHRMNVELGVAGRDVSEIRQSGEDKRPARVLSGIPQGRTAILARSRLTAAVAVLACVMFAQGAAADDPGEVEVDLQVGDVAPMFVGTDHHGNEWRLEDHLGKDYVVIYFYPADFTTGCTRQAVVWRENLNLLANTGIEVVGISGDTVANHQLFRKTWELNFTLIANPEASIPPLFGVPVRRGGKAFARDSNGNPLLDAGGNQIKPIRPATFVRWTFVIDPAGKIVYKNTKVSPTKDSEQVLEFIRKLRDQAETS